MHRPVQPLDAVPSFLFPSIFRLGPLCFSGLPRTQHALAASATNLRVAPNLQSIGCAGDGSPSCLESLILQRCGRVRPGLPRHVTPPAPPSDAFLGLPLVVHLPALPVMDLRVAPNFASFGGAGGEAVGLPRLLPPPVSPTTRLRVAPNPVSPGTGWCVSRLPWTAPSGFASGESLGLPECSSPLATPVDELPGCPGSSIPRRCRLIPPPSFPGFRTFQLPAYASSGCPGSASAVGSMMNPCCPRTLHPRLNRG